MRHDKKYYWVKINDRWVIGKWSELHKMWHLINGIWVRDDKLQEINEDEIAPPK